MKTSLSPIALAALLVGPGLTAWARQDAPAPPEPAAPPSVEPAGVPLLAGVPLVGGVRAEQDDVQDLTEEELALQDKLRALEQRAAELEAVLRDRLDAAEAQARQGGTLGRLLHSDEEYEAMSARVRELVGRLDQAKLDPDAVQKAEEFHARAEEMRALAETQRELAEAKRAEVERLRYTEAHPRYRVLQDEAEKIERSAEEIARAEMRARRAEGAMRREKQEIYEAQQAAERNRREAENARRMLEQELVKREVQRRREENRLRSELDSERARLAEMRAKLEQTRAEMKENAPRPERPRATDLWVQRAAPRAEPQRPASSDVTIIVEQGDVHVHTGGGAPQVFTPRTSRQSWGNALFGRDVPLPAPPARPEPPARPDPPGTTKAPAPTRYWRGAARPEGVARAQVEYIRARGLAGGDRRFPLPGPDFELELPDHPFEYVELELELPDVEFDFPDVEFEALDAFFQQPDVLEVAPECDAPPEMEGEGGFIDEPLEEPVALEFEGGVVVRGDGTQVHANRVSFDLAASPAERAPTQAELLDRILQLSEELKAEVGALRGELRELREVVRDAPRR